MAVSTAFLSTCCSCCCCCCCCCCCQLPPNSFQSCLPPTTTPTSHDQPACYPALSIKRCQCRIDVDDEPAQLGRKWVDHSVIDAVQKPAGSWKYRKNLNLILIFRYLSDNKYACIWTTSDMIISSPWPVEIDACPIFLIPGQSLSLFCCLVVTFFINLTTHLKNLCNEMLPETKVHYC